MFTLRFHKHIARLVLVWFVLGLLVAISSPIAKPKINYVVCTSMGVMPVGDQGDDQQDGSKKLDCPACFAGAISLNSRETIFTQPFPIVYSLQRVVAAHIAAITAPPLPSRGPPRHPKIFIR
jgi:hypothetical protein